MALYFVSGVSFMIFGLGLSLVFDGSHPQIMAKHVRILPYAAQSFPPRWMIGGVVGIVIYAVMLFVPKIASFYFMDFLADKQVIYLVPMSNVLEWGIPAGYYVQVNAAAYFLLGLVIAFLYRLYKCQMRIRESKGVKFLGTSLICFPIFNLLIVHYPQLHIIRPDIFKSQYPFHYLAGLFDHVSYLSALKAPLNQMVGFVLSHSLSIELLVFLLLTVGILGLRKWAYYLLMAISFYVIINSVYGLLQSSHVPLLATIKNCILLSYFAILILYFNNPNVKDQFSGILSEKF